MTILVSDFLIEIIKSLTPHSITVALLQNRYLSKKTNKILILLNDCDFQVSTFIYIKKKLVVTKISIFNI